MCLSKQERTLPAFPSGSAVKNGLQCRKSRFDPGFGKVPWRRARQPTPVFCLKNPMDRGAHWVTVHGVTGLKRLSLHKSSYRLIYNSVSVCFHS